MTKTDVINVICNKHEGWEQADVLAHINAFFDEVCVALERGDEVRMREYGKFYPVFRKARRGRMFGANQPMQIPARYEVTFDPGRAMIDAVKRLKTEAV